MKILIKPIKTSLIKITLVTCLLFICLDAFADSFIAYQGKYKAELIKVISGDVIELSVPVWTGFNKKFKMQLLNTATPVVIKDVPVCQLEMAARALKFSRDFLKQAEYLQVSNIRMENTAEEDAQSTLKTQAGYLGTALTEAGLGRPRNISNEVYWCEDEESTALSGKDKKVASTKVVSSDSKKTTATTTGFLQEITEIRVHSGPDRSGEEVYEFRCKGCHAKNTQGAPMPDDHDNWQQRRAKGFDVLMKHAMQGYNNYLMPPKGGCRDCNENEILNAVNFMLESSGNKPGTLKKQG